MSEPEMRLVGDEAGVVYILCERKGCLVPGDCYSKLCYLEIEVDRWATPLDIDRIWMAHRREHANLEK